MTAKTKKYKCKPQTIDEDCQTIDAPDYDAYKDFQIEPSGHYVLIRVKRDEGVIEVAITTKDHRIIKIFRGTSPQQIYHTIFKVEKEEGANWFQSKDHIAYLGKELARAELYLNAQIPKYLQE